MALKALVLRKKITDKKAELEALRSKSAEFITREAELEASVAEATSEEDVAVVEQAIEAFEAEKTAHETAVSDLQREVDVLENELSEIESQTETTPAVNAERNERKVSYTMEKRFKNFTIEQRTAFVQQDNVHNFIERVRELGMTKRSVRGADLLIPDEVMPLIREEIATNSKLLPFLRVVSVSGTTRQPIAGSIPEAVWTEACANINELDISFNAVDVDGYKVAGYIAICNSVLEDSDVALASEIISAIGGAIAKAIDKAILFGTGVKMPVGIMTRLAQTEQPASWGANYPAWTDLHASNILSLDIDNAYGTEFFSALIEALATAKPVYSTDGLFWVMNRKTHLHIMAKALAVNSNGAIVANTAMMPIVGGTIVEIEDEDLIADNVIIGGYGGNYLMAERAGARFAQSDIPMFLADQTVFKGTARYDGMPIAGEAFIAVNFADDDPSAEADFPVDYANMEMYALGLTASAGNTTGKTIITVTDGKDPENELKYITKKTLNGLKLKVGDTVDSKWSTLNGGVTEITADRGVNIVVVELDENNRVVGAGQCVSVPKT
ncbi:MAG: phage major capsid protein [Bacteroidaceae bacterium]|nr:phage major capsid protein [Bacteroidaceae bacterium]